MREWIEFNPAWNYVVYDRRSAADYLKQKYGSLLSEAFLDIRLPAMMADVFRVARILADGGLYVDAATFCKGSLESWLPRERKLVLLAKPHMDPSRQCWSGFLYAPKRGHPFLRSLWLHISLMITARKGRHVWRDFGPGLYWRALESEEMRETVRILPLDSLRKKIISSSSSSVLSHNQHWSKLQASLDSLYEGNGRSSLASWMARSRAKSLLFIHDLKIFSR